MANYKSSKNISDRWNAKKHAPKIIIGSALFLFVLLVVIAMIGQETKEFDAPVARRIEEIHALIAQGNYREIYLHESRRLITSHNEKDFNELLDRTRPFLNGRIEKNCETIYKDMVNRLRRNLLLSFEMETACQVEAVGLKSFQSFGWQSDGSRIKLIWFDFTPQNR